MPEKAWEGSLEELVRRAQAGEVDLREVSLAEAVRAGLQSLPEEDLEARTVFLQQASLLVALKSRQLLPARPRPEEVVPEAPEEVELPAPDEAYQAFREVASALAALEALQSQVFTRPAPDVDPAEVPLVGVSLEDLQAAFRRVLNRSRPEVREILPEGVRVEDRMRVILEVLARAPEGVAFEALFGPEDPRLVVIVTFLALLELVRQRRVRIEQARPFAPIRVYRVDISG